VSGDDDIALGGLAQQGTSEGKFSRCTVISWIN
jgi:hypothetical protein